MISALIPLFSFSSILGEVLIVMLSILMIVGIISTALDIFCKGNIWLWVTLNVLLVSLDLFSMYLFGVDIVFGFVLFSFLLWLGIRHAIKYPSI